MQKVSIIISAYNEEKNINPLYLDLCEVLSEIKLDSEIIFVNDGSTDRTLLYCRELQKSDQRVKIVNLTRNFGHEIAMIAGTDYATGDAVIFMDADLQHPPRYIKDMINMWQSGNKIVLTHRRSNADNNLIHRLFSGLFYGLLNFLSDVKIPRATPDFRLIDKKYIDFLKRFDERDSMFRGTLSLVCDVSKAPVIKFDAPRRRAGKSKYNFIPSIKLAVNGITQFSVRPLHLAMYFAIVMGLLSGSLGMYAIIERFFLKNPTPGYATIISAITFTGAIILFVLAILGMYIGKIHIETKKRPLYFAEYIEKYDEDNNKRG